MGAKKAVVAMSGGVDSSVAAALLVEQGYEVTGIMLKLWQGGEANHNSGCCNLGAANDARRVADVLGIRFYVLNFAERFADTVVRDFNATYSAGRTPNPCIRCNQWIKFDALFERARALGADVLATGHYARTKEVDGRVRLLRGIDSTKDQSYVLWMLTQKELANVRFPVGRMHKRETRAIAEELGLRTARKPDSQEICFVRDGDLGRYVDENLAGRPGPIYTTGGEHVGEHRGISRYTVGQRKGLGVSLGRPAFVTRIDPAANAIVVGERRELAVGSLVVEEASFVNERVDDGTEVLVQHRAHGEVTRARLCAAGAGRLEVRFEQPLEAVAPGQSVAFYRSRAPEELLGGGVIAATRPAPVAA